MQPTEGFSVQRRALDVEDYIDVVRRHKGWIFGPFLFTLVASVVGVYLYPDTYVSQGVIKIVPQQVPPNMVQPAVNSEMSDRIFAMSQNIESRTVLTSIINTFGLYKKEISRMPTEDVIEQIMKKAIIITPVASIGGSGRQVPAFTVQFSYEDRHLAQQVVEDLVSKFIDEYNSNSSSQSVLSTQFFKDQADNARKELDEIENRLTEFKVKNNGKLPDQIETNRQQLNTLQTNATFYSASFDRANADKIQLESQLSIYRDRMAALTKESKEVAATPQKTQAMADAEHEVEGFQNQLRELKQVYQDTFPDVVLAKTRLANAEKKRDDLAKSEEESRKASPARSANPQAQREILDLNERIRQTQSLIEAKQIEIEGFNKDLKRSNGLINQYQSRIETIPLGTKEYDDLERDREMAKQKYQEMDAKLAHAQTAADMESRQQGETLAILDAASLPTQVSEPKRPMIIGLGAAFGLLLGIVIAGAREMKDTSLKNLKDVRAYTQMAILGSIPLLENDFVVRRRRRLAWLGWTTACLAAVVVVSGSIVYYYSSKQ
jgi:succinoglycan biosynthesis transport protein ExoP